MHVLTMSVFDESLKIGWDHLEYKVQRYKGLFDYRGFVFGGPAAMFSTTVILALSVSIFGLLVSARLKSKPIFLYSIILLTGVIFYFSFLELKIAADRIFNLFFSVIVFLVPALIWALKEKRVAALSTCLGCGVMFWALHGAEFRAYETWILK